MAGAILPTSGAPAMALAILTTYLTPYRIPLYERLAERFGAEVLCYGGGERYVPAWFADLDAQLARAPFPARRIDGPGAALRAARTHDAVIAPFAGGAMLPAAYAGTRLGGGRFVLWASVWAPPRSASHVLARPLTDRIYRHADGVIAYGEHVRAFVSAIRGHGDGVFVAPQSVEAELFGRRVETTEVAEFRRRHDLPDRPIALYVGRLVPEKGIEVLLQAWSGIEATLVVIGDGPLAGAAARASGVRVLGARPRSELPVAYAAAELAVLPSIPTPRFREPWGLVCNEAMHQGRPVIATDAVGAVAGGLVRDGVTGIVVPAGDASALRGALERLLADGELRARLGHTAVQAVAAYNYEAMVEAFARALGRY